MHRILVVTLLSFVTAPPVPAEGRPARPAPALPPPSGIIVNVSTVAALQTAVTNLKSNTSIIIAPGTYRLTTTLYIKGPLTNVAIRGATGDSDDVVLLGPGMRQSSFGSVPFGIWTGGGVDGVTIANLTIRDFYHHPIILNAPTERPLLHNLHLIDAGEQFIKSNPNAAGIGPSNGVLRYSIIEFTDTARSDYPKGIDVHGGANWIIRHNLFRNLVGPPGQVVTGPAVLVWRGSSNTLTEGNTFVNVTRGISYGGDDRVTPSHRGGIIRNNFFVRAASQPGDVGIIVSHSPETHVLNNTVLLSGTYRSAIEYRYANTTQLLIANNLVDAPIRARDGATATLLKNMTSASRTMFVDAAAGNLHLNAGAAAIDAGQTLTQVAADWDGELRPAAGGHDIGADERQIPPYRIAGRVVDATSGSGVAGVTLTLSGERSGTAFTGASGTFSFSGLPPGSYTVAPSSAGYMFSPERHSVASLLSDEEVTFTATLFLPVARRWPRLSGWTRTDVADVIAGHESRSRTLTRDSRLRRTHCSKRRRPRASTSATVLQ
jgi:hypothetical protein